MSVQIQFDGETMDEVVAQARALVAAFGGVPEHTPAQAAVLATVAPRTRRTKAQIEADAKAEAEKSEAENPAAVADAGLSEANAKAKEEALVLARGLFATGAAGQEQCRRVAKDFGVKKLGDVPVERGLDLLGSVKEAEVVARMAGAPAEAESIV